MPERAPSSNQALEQSIIEEGRRMRTEQPESWPGFMNNFWGVVLPEDNGKFISYRQKEKFLGWWDKKLKDIINPTEKEAHSELRLNQTSEEFYSTIDTIVTAVDTSGEIRKLFEELKDVSNFEEREVWQNKLEELLIPVYAKLISMGYQPHELRM